MSNSHRFYIKTFAPDILLKEISVLVGDTELKPVNTIGVSSTRITPEREGYGSPIVTDEASGWFLLGADVDFNSKEARLLAKMLFSSEFVEMSAEDNEVGADSKDSEACIIDRNHWLLEEEKK